MITFKAVTAAAARYDVSVPESVELAGSRVAALERARRTTRVTPAAHADAILTAEDVDEAASAAAEALAVDKARGEVLDEALKAARKAADRAAAVGAYEIANAILGSSAVRGAFEVLAETAPGLLPSAPFTPDLGRHGAALVIASTRVRAAHEVLCQVAMSLERDLDLSLVGTTPGEEIPEAAVRRLAGALISDPAKASSALEWDKAARGVQGSDGMSWQTRPGVAGGIYAPMGQQRLAPVLLAHLPGVRLELAANLEEFETRHRRHLARWNAEARGRSRKEDVAVFEAQLDGGFIEWQG